MNFLLTIKGLVQGVGFRPFLFRVATEMNLKGWVKNTNHAVFVHVQGREEHIQSFIEKIKNEHPYAARIDSIVVEDAANVLFTEFSILESTSGSQEVTSVSPDLAVCNECLHDMAEQPLRKNYPLVNCCHCGPRFSIIKELPYDRERTTMADFKMCPDCAKEYNNPTDRRFHAQPVACNQCGPVYSLFFKKGKEQIEIKDINQIHHKLKNIIHSGGIVAFKGTGGFHLVCDAHNEKAVSQLRALKHRDTKPFAVMFRNMEALKKYTRVSEAEETEISSFRRPILILEQTKELAPSVSLGLSTIGSMLPYMPFHHLFFQNITADCLVMTSGNISDEPVIIDNQQALNSFVDTTEAVLTYNRDIHNRLDDSVISVVNHKPRIIRRSRGYVPDNITLNTDVEGILATGAELTGGFAIGKNSDSILGQYCGDLQNVGNFDFYKESLNRFEHLYRFSPKLVVHDLHPDYVSTRFANEINAEKIAVQHHHAHVASVIAEHSIQGPVIGLAFDGTGLGTDGKIWGSEFLLCSGIEFQRLAHFEYTPLPGGDKVVIEPWRTAVGQLYHYFGKDIFKQEIPFFKYIEKMKLKLIEQALEKNIQLAWSCSAGRLFDAVAAISGICLEPKFHAEAPMRLEAHVDSNCKFAYSYSFKDGIIGFKTLWEELLKDVEQNISKSVIATKFHNCIVNVIIETCRFFRNNNQVNIVALSGGSFQNKYLLKAVENKLFQEGFKVFSNEKVPCNDGGIALGQMFLAAKMRNNNLKK